MSTFTYFEVIQSLTIMRHNFSAGAFLFITSGVRVCVFHASFSIIIIMMICMHFSWAFLLLEYSLSNSMGRSL